MLFSFIIGELVKKCGNDKISALVAGFLIFSCTSLNQIIGNDWTFTFDVYWIACVLLSVLLLKNNFLRWAVPILTFVGIWINYAYTLSCVPLVFIAILYELYGNKNQRKSELLLQIRDQLKNLCLRCNIQRCGRFVTDH